jgi:sugar phosphate isomerase/epimerase
MEVHARQLGPGLPGVPVFEAHAAAAGEVLRKAGLIVSSLNVVGDQTFDPFAGPDALDVTIKGLAAHLRWAAAMGAPRVLIWEGRVEGRAGVDLACRTLSQAIEAATDESGLETPPTVSCELHPFTFGLKHRALGELASALTSVGAGICFDFCHFGVGLGRDFLSHLDDGVVVAIDHVHYSDTDTTTSELHFPPGDGVLDLDAIEERIAGKPIALSWDLFGWPGPRAAVRERMDVYRGFVERHAATVAAG